MFVMLNCRKEVGSVQCAVGRFNRRALGRRLVRHRTLLLLLLTAHCPLLTASCRRDMQDQPKAIAYRESTFFKDGVSSRPPVEGTVPRGYLRADREFYFGKKPGYRTGSGSDRVIDSTGQQPGAG